MKIAVLYPKEKFTDEQKNRLSALGEAVYMETPAEYDFEAVRKIAVGADILAVDPDNLGGFEKVKPRLTEVMKTLPNLKGLALDTTSFGWVDLEYCKKNNIPVSNVPGYSRESVAELAIIFLLGLSLKIFLADKRTQKGKFVLEGGNELKGKTLGIIGLGNIGSRVAELASSLGMKIIAYNRSPKTVKGVEMKSLDDVLSQSDYITLHLTHSNDNRELINKELLSKMKEGVMIANTVDRDTVNEKDMAEALKSGKVAGYAYEGEDLENTPLAKFENAFGFKSVAWYTKEARENLVKIWIENIEALAKGRPQNIVS